VLLCKLNCKYWLGKDSIVISAIETGRSGVGAGQFPPPAFHEDNWAEQVAPRLLALIQHFEICSIISVLKIQGTVLELKRERKPHLILKYLKPCLQWN